MNYCSDIVKKISITSFCILIYISTSCLILFFPCALISNKKKNKLIYDDSLNSTSYCIVP